MLAFHGEGGAFSTTIVWDREDMGQSDPSEKGDVVHCEDGWRSHGRSSTYTSLLLVGSTRHSTQTYTPPIKSMLTTNELDTMSWF